MRSAMESFVMKGDERVDRVRGSGEVEERGDDIR